jgi:phosphoribosylglycinamide formyltransferase 1
MKIGFLASHGGSNMQSIINAIKSGKLDATAAVVISNNSKSKALERAENEGIPCFHISGIAYNDADQLDKAIADKLQEYEVDVVVLAGYMKKIGNRVLEAFSGRILNIHPALLPKYGGKGMFGDHVHTAVLAAEEKVSGPTVHLVDEIFDNGRILAQKEVPVMQGDTVETLSARVLEQEHIIYWETLQNIAKGEIVL